MEKSAETVEKLGKGSGCDPIALEDLGRALETQQTHALDRVVILAQESDQLVQLIDKLVGYYVHQLIDDSANLGVVLMKSLNVSLCSKGRQFVEFSPETYYCIAGTGCGGNPR